MLSSDTRTVISVQDGSVWDLLQGHRHEHQILACDTKQDKKFNLVSVMFYTGTFGMVNPMWSTDTRTVISVQDGSVWDLLQGHRHWHRKQSTKYYEYEISEY